MTALKTTGFIFAAFLACCFSQSADASVVNFSLSLSGSLAGSGTLTITDGPVPTGPTSQLIVPKADISTFTITVIEGQRQFQFNLLNSSFNTLEFQGGSLFDITDTSSSGTGTLQVNGTQAVFTDSAGQQGVVENITAIAAVPEASTWAMLLLGFAGLGLIASRRGKSFAVRFDPRWR